LAKPLQNDENPYFCANQMNNKSVIKNSTIMKKLFVAGLALIAYIGVSAQAPVVSAFTYLRNGQLDRAKNQIDFAVKDDKCKGLSKTWFYRGNIYLAIFLSQEEKYKKLDTNSLMVAYEAYQKAIEIEPKIMNERLNPYSAEVGLVLLADLFVNRGIDVLETQNYKDALANFEMARRISRAFNMKDTIATYGAALCHVNLKDMDNAKLMFEDLVRNNYRQSVVYTELANIYRAGGDTARALTTIQRGRRIMPADLNLILAETSVYLMQGRTQEAQALLDVAVEKDPENPTLHFAIGVNMAEFNNFEAAEKSYMRALALKKDFFDALYNLGALYVNTAASIMEEANKLPIGDPKYDSDKAVADEMLKKAIPYLEQAEVFQPNDVNTLVSLKNLYTRVGDVEKLKVVDDKLHNLPK
jgi:tetratricopeptide (TPR) repeat protein